VSQPISGRRPSLRGRATENFAAGGSHSVLKLTHQLVQHRLGRTTGSVGGRERGHRKRQERGACHAPHRMVSSLVPFVRWPGQNPGWLGHRRLARRSTDPRARRYVSGGDIGTRRAGRRSSSERVDTLRAHERVAPRRRSGRQRRRPLAHARARFPRRSSGQTLGHSAPRRRGIAAFGRHPRSVDVGSLRKHVDRCGMHGFESLALRQESSPRNRDHRVERRRMSRVARRQRTTWTASPNPRSRASRRMFRRRSKLSANQAKISSSVPLPT